jgi:hypothetical protein
LFTGRFIEIPVFPFSFSEFAQYFSEEAKGMPELFDEYVIKGGLAGSYEYKKESDRVAYIKDVYTTPMVYEIGESISFDTYEGGGKCYTNYFNGDIREFLSKEDLLKRTSLSSTLLKKLESMGVLEGMQEENQLSLFSF